MLELDAVSKTYREGDITVHALREVHLSIAAQGFTMIVGPSGSGKTTLLNLMGTLDRPSAGQVVIEGRNVSAMGESELTRFRAARVGFIFQSYNLMPVLSACENVEYALVHNGMPASQRRLLARQALDAVGLSTYGRHRPNQLSGGQRQRVAIARALVKRPALVLADEPTANLDSANGAAIVTLMRRMQSEFQTRFVFSTHDPQLMTHADQLLRVHDGRVAESPVAALGAPQ